jgi:hypothetical protein
MGFFSMTVTPKRRSHNSLGSAETSHATTQNQDVWQAIPLLLPTSQLPRSASGPASGFAFRRSIRAGQHPRLDQQGRVFHRGLIQDHVACRVNRSTTCIGSEWKSPPRPSHIESTNEIASSRWLNVW